MDNNLIKNIQNMFPLWTIKNIRFSDYSNSYAEVDPTKPYVVSGTTASTLSIDMDSHQNPAPKWLARYIEKMEGRFPSDGPNLETITFNFPNSLSEFMANNKKSIDRYSKENWNAMIRRQFEAVFDGEIEEQHG